MRTYYGCYIRYMIFHIVVDVYVDTTGRKGTVRLCRCNLYFLGDMLILLYDTRLPNSVHMERCTRGVRYVIQTLKHITI